MRPVAVRSAGLRSADAAKDGVLLRGRAGRSRIRTAAGCNKGGTTGCRGSPSCPENQAVEFMFGPEGQGSATRREPHGPGPCRATNPKSKRIRTPAACHRRTEEGKAHRRPPEPGEDGMALRQRSWSTDTWSLGEQLTARLDTPLEGCFRSLEH
jgi:hypothetical protein